MMKHLLNLGSVFVLLMSLSAIGHSLSNITNFIMLNINKDKVFYVTSYNDGRTSYRGTGFHLANSKGEVYLLTNAHVCGEPDAVIAVDSYGSVISTPSSIVAVDYYKDLCAIKPVPNAPVYTLNSEWNNLAAKSYVVSYPLDFPLQTTSGQVVGYIYRYFPVPLSLMECVAYGLYMNNEGECMASNKVLQTQIEIRNGSSGAPLLNFMNQVEGMVTIADSGWWAIAITPKDINAFIEGI